MGYYIALQKNIKNGVIKGYNVKAPNGEIVYVDKQKVKDAINSKQAIFLNLMIDNSGRLISSSEHITGKLKIVADAIKSITKDNYNSIELKDNYMEAIFSGGEYILQSTFDCKNIILLLQGKTLNLSNKDDVIKCANYIKSLKEKLKAPDEKNIEKFNNNDKVITLLYSDISRLAKDCFNSRKDGIIINEYTKRLADSVGLPCGTTGLEIRIDDNVYSEIHIEIHNQDTPDINVIYIQDENDNKVKIKFEQSLLNKIIVVDKTNERLYIDMYLIQSSAEEIYYKQGKLAYIIHGQGAYIDRADLYIGMIIAEKALESSFCFGSVIIRGIDSPYINVKKLFGDNLEIYSEQCSVDISVNSLCAIDNVKLVSNKNTSLSAYRRAFFSKNIQMYCKVRSAIRLYNIFDTLNVKLGLENKYIRNRVEKKMLDKVNTYSDYSLANGKCYVTMRSENAYIGNLYGDIVMNIDCQDINMETKYMNKEKNETIDYVAPYEFIKDQIKDKLCIDKDGAMFIGSANNIVLKDIIIAKELDTNNSMSGIIYNQSSIKESSLTILNSIKTTKRKEDYHSIRSLKHIVDQIVNLSKLIPVNVMYGTQAYEILRSAGAKLNILNKDAMSEQLSRRSIKESAIGINTLEKLHKDVRNISLTEDAVDIPVKVIAKIPEQYYIFFGVNSTIKEVPTILNDSATVLYSINLLNKIGNIPEMFSENALKALMSNTYIKDIRPIRYNNTQQISVKLLFLAETASSTTDIIMIIHYNDLVLAAAYMSDFMILAKSAVSLDDNRLSVYRKLKDIEKINFETNYMKQELTLNTYENEKELINDIGNELKSGIIFGSTKHNALIVPMAYDEIKLFKAKISVKKELIKLNMTHVVYKIAGFTEISNNKKSDIKDLVSKDYEHSAIKSLLDNKDKYTNVDTNILPDTEVSTLFQICEKYSNEISLYKDRNYKVRIPLQLLLDLIQLPAFNILSSDKALGVIDSSYVRLQYNSNKEFFDNNVDIDTYYINKQTSRIKSIATTYMKNVRYITKISYNNADIYVASEKDIDAWLKIMKNIVINKKNAYSSEEYISYIGMIKPWELNELYVGIANEQLDFIVDTYIREYSNCLITVFQSMHRWEIRDERKINTRRISRQVVICIDPKIGWMYLCVALWFSYTINIENGMMIPLTRIRNFRDACLLAHEISKIDATANDISNTLIGDIVHGYPSIQSLILNQYNNNSRKIDYGTDFEYINIISKKTHELKFETNESKFTQKNVDNKLPVLKGYNLGYIIKYVNMGGIQIIPNIQNGYKLVKSYIGENSSDQIDEYRSENSEYILYVIKGTIFKTEYEIQDLLDI